MARVSETIEETEEDDAAIPLKEPTMRSPRSANNLHVTINSMPEELECCNDGSGDTRKMPTNEEGGGGGRRPSALIHEILSSRRPSAIMAAIRSSKQFVTRYRREYGRESINLFFFFVVTFSHYHIFAEDQ